MQRAHSIADLIDHPESKPCPFDHAISVTYTATNTQPLPYAEWYYLAVANGFRPCPDDYPAPDASSDEHAGDPVQPDPR